MTAAFPVVAIVAAYNEADVIDHVVRDLIAQGVHVYFMDDGSTDDTVAVVERHLGRGVIGVEALNETLPDRIPGKFEWRKILKRKAEVAAGLNADWFIHHDADEFRESWWLGEPLAESIRRVDQQGYNAIDFATLDFVPHDDCFQTGTDVRDAYPFFAPSADFNRLQIRCWKRTLEPIDLASTGGHEAIFPGRKVFPLRFVLRHYPIRSREHGERKIARERHPRFLDEERAAGWHVQYDGSSPMFIRQSTALERYDPQTARASLAFRHRGVEALEAAVAAARTDLANAATDLEAAHREIAALAADRDRYGPEAIARQEVELVTARATIVDLHARLGACSKELDRFRHSASWRVTAPLRAAYRLLLRR
jgi:hypothetical protein